jgi:hypothetical protein
MISETQLSQSQAVCATPADGGLNSVTEIPPRIFLFGFSSPSATGLPDLIDQYNRFLSNKAIPRLDPRYKVAKYANYRMALKAKRFLLFWPWAQQRHLTDGRSNRPKNDLNSIRR